MTKKEIDKNTLALELVTLHYMENLFAIPLEILKDFSSYNRVNDVSSGFVELCVTQQDVGKPVFEYLIEILPHFCKLSKYHWQTIINMPESRAEVKP